MHDDYLEHAQREMIPKMKESAICLILWGRPDAKLCLEVGAAILLNKPLLVMVPRGEEIPLALRTIATKIIEFDRDQLEASNEAIGAAIKEMMEAARFRSSPLIKGEGGQH